MQALSYQLILEMVIDKLYTQQDFLSCALAGMLIQSMLCSACQPTNMTYDTTIQVPWCLLQSP